MTPLALRFGSRQLSSTPASTSINSSLGTYLPAGTAWFISLDDVPSDEYYFLVGGQGSSLYLQLLHPALDLWTRPLLVNYQVIAIPNTSGTSIAQLPGIPGKIVLGTAGSNLNIGGTPSKVGLAITLLAAGYYDAPRFYSVFYT